MIKQFIGNASLNTAHSGIFYMNIGCKCSLHYIKWKSHLKCGQVLTTLNSCLSTVTFQPCRAWLVRETCLEREWGEWERRDWNYNGVCICWCIQDKLTEERKCQLMVVKTTCLVFVWWWKPPVECLCVCLLLGTVRRKGRVVRFVRVILRLTLLLLQVFH